MTMEKYTLLMFFFAYLAIGLAMFELFTGTNGTGANGSDRGQKRKLAPATVRSRRSKN